MEIGSMFFFSPFHLKLILFEKWNVSRPFSAAIVDEEQNINK